MKVFVEANSENKFQFSSLSLETLFLCYQPKFSLLWFLLFSLQPWGESNQREDSSLKPQRSKKSLGPKKMWDLNDSPHQTLVEEESEELCYSSPGKRVGSFSNSSSSAVVIEDGSDDDEPNRVRPNNPLVTHQFFPEMETSVGDDGGGGPGSGFPRSHWFGVKFCQSDLATGSSAGKPATVAAVVEPAQPLKKSRRGPRSRSSQYRGVTFYRRTGRWESHIW